MLEVISLLTLLLRQGQTAQDKPKTHHYIRVVL